ncbi:MAG: type 4a pilus biogenesis protein PilO [Phycisphaerae bacterium]
MKFGLRELIFLGVVMVIPICAWAFDFKPRNEDNEQMLEQIEAKQARLRELNQATAVIGDLETEIGALKNAIGYFQSKLPNEKEIDKVLQEVWRLAEENKLTAKSIRTMDRSRVKNNFVMPGGPHAEQPITMKLEGDFMGFYTFLQALEAQQRIMRVRTMKLKKPRNGPQGRMEAEFEMTIFFEKSKG